MGEKTAKKGFGCPQHFLAKDCAEGHRRRLQGIYKTYIYAHIVGRGKGNSFPAFFTFLVFDKCAANQQAEWKFQYGGCSDTDRYL